MLKETTKNTKSVFNGFTGKYALSKTSRFELKPVGKTLENMHEHLEYDKALLTFMKDQRIEDAYQLLKPLVNGLHEKFIGMSLESDAAKSMAFSEYINLREKKFGHEEILKKEGKNKFDIAGNKEAQKLNNELDKIGDNLRREFDNVFDQAGKNWRRIYNKYEWRKGGQVMEGARVLSSKSVFLLIGDLNNSDAKIQDALKKFKGFFTYFGGFNQNRENYYETKKEAATAIATRIIHENLPRFTDNALVFKNRKFDYVSAYKFLEKLNRMLKDKDGKDLHPISEVIFHSDYFKNCLSQREIENYNAEIGNANFVINLYNQARRSEEKFKRMQIFKKIKKQIGCGKKDSFFFALTHEKKSDAEDARKQNEDGKFFSVEEIIELAARAGREYLKENNGGVIDTLSEFIEYIKSREDYTGFYWSKTAFNTISNKYFSNWRDLKDRLRSAKVFKKGGKNDEEDVKIPEAIELQPFFEVLDATSDWKTALFKRALLDEKSEQNKFKIINLSQNAHEALLGMIAEDLQTHAEKFISDIAEVGHLTKEYFAITDSDKIKEERRKEWKEAIKAWMDNALAVNRMLKYFMVRENKAKGAPIDPVLSQALDVLLYGKEDEVEWFKWYDALRNFLTKKPQDDAKENKLKLNFENGSLLGGWSDGQEKNKAAVLLRKDDAYYLGILKKKNIFDTKRVDNPVYQSTSQDAGRLILKNLGFKTLSGKGFKEKFKKKYSTMGKEDPQKAIRCFQEIIRERYVKEYPLLQKVSETLYTDKKKFDQDVRDALQESYFCAFKDINWQAVEDYTNSGDMYLFRIFCKDFAARKSGKRDLQTIYWEALFENLSPHQLCGGGEIFYRMQALKEKKVKEGYNAKPWVIKKKRFAEDGGKFSFHCPVKLNYKAPPQSEPKYAFPFVNKYINEGFLQCPDIRFLGIDRGEKHLAYYSFVNAQGAILDQGTLNMPFTDKNGKPRAVKAIKRFLKDGGEETEESVECWDYNDLLEARAGNRDYARKNWQTIGTIKELKEGYISQIIYKIAKLAASIENYQPTFIILEDLNAGFMRGRQKIEKSVYKQFEVALMKKLNFLVDKSKDGKYGEIGSVTAALQLTPPVKNYEELKERGKQAGIMLFVRPDYTSQTDPVTGWRKKIYISGGSEDGIKSSVIEHFDDIYFDGRDYIFAYTDKDTGNKWKMYSGQNGKSIDRFHRECGDHGKWVSVRQDVAGMLDRIFADFDKNRSLLSQIVDEDMKLKKINEHTAWESLRFAINLIQQIRNTGEDANKRSADFLLSPVRDKHDNHFDSRFYWDKAQRGEKAELPVCGDANGAYNIARKGVILNEHMKRNLKLYVRDEEWDAWLAGKDVWEKWLNSNIQKVEKNKNEEWNPTSKSQK